MSGNLNPSSMDYVNAYLDSVYTQLYTILSECNEIFVEKGISPADTYTDLPTAIEALAALVPTPEPEPEPEPTPDPEPDLDPGNNEEPNESEEENNG